MHPSKISVIKLCINKQFYKNGVLNTCELEI
jgi:hypothetical protein